MAKFKITPQMLGMFSTMLGNSGLLGSAGPMIGMAGTTLAGGHPALQAVQSLLGGGGLLGAADAAKKPEEDDAEKPSVTSPEVGEGLLSVEDSKRKKAISQSMMGIGTGIANGGWTPEMIQQLMELQAMRQAR